METKIANKQQTFQKEPDTETVQSQYSIEEQQKIFKLFQILSEIDKSMKKKNESN
ncbi:MAG TPA: hypothetical protein PLL26_06015 [Candidatus Dojkabacteria bacterium]|nr:hypothetical protein [Candidatus Dojkabacteria bacterium]